ncbi:MAG: ribosomal L7Ae/L30e/S12e/Gadd45 family protein [Clostridia bacterium]|nr:ribosomal L7Ae/L30e/S12e/Gadd45 family protein [Clostridia bacterium]
MIDKKILGLIGLASRARKICFGADSVEIEIKKRKVNQIIIAEDASDRTKEKFKKLSKEYNIPILIIGEIDILSKAIGKSNKAIIGIEEPNISSEIQKISNGGEDIG